MPTALHETLVEKAASALEAVARDPMADAETRLESLRSLQLRVASLIAGRDLVPLKTTRSTTGFRKVRIVCSECSGESMPSMRLRVGEYQWDCNICGRKTTHVVSEVSPKAE